MSVWFVYQGTFGNNLFQYMIARLFADEHNLKLETPWKPIMDERSAFDVTKVMNILPQESGRSFDSPKINFGDHSEIFGKKWEDGRYGFHGFFQRSKVFYDRRETVLKIARPVPVEKRSAGDIVMTVRLGPYVANEDAIHPEWYRKILDQESFDKLYIVTDSLVGGYTVGREYFNAFKKYNPIMVSGAAHDDWNFVRSFRRVICANSTFHWWAVFFSKPDKVWTFKRWLKRLVNPEIPHFPGSIPVDGKFLHELPKLPIQE